MIATNLRSCIEPGIVHFPTNFVARLCRCRFPAFVKCFSRAPSLTGVLPALHALSSRHPRSCRSMNLGAYARQRPDRVALAVLTLANVGLVFALPILGGHDLPQHLSYARILADYDNP